jgi:hypothetical protein
MWYLFSKEKRDAARALFADPESWKGNPTLRAEQLEEALNAALDELDVRDAQDEGDHSAIIGGGYFIFDEARALEELEKGRALLAEKNSVQEQFKTPHYIVDRNLAKKHGLELEEFRRLVLMAETAEADHQARSPQPISINEQAQALRRLKEEMEREGGRGLSWRYVAGVTGMGLGKINQILQDADAEEAT